MTTAQVVETSVTVNNNNSPILDYVRPDDRAYSTYDIVVCLLLWFNFIVRIILTFLWGKVTYNNGFQTKENKI